MLFLYVLLITYTYILLVEYLKYLLGPFTNCALLCYLTSTNLLWFLCRAVKKSIRKGILFTVSLFVKIKGKKPYIFERSKCITALEYTTFSLVWSPLKSKFVSSKSIKTCLIILLKFRL